MSDLAKIREYAISADPSRGQLITDVMDLASEVEHKQATLDEA